MAKTLEAEQNALTLSSGLSIVTLVKLTTYTDRASKSGPTVFYFADKPTTYDYDNEGTDRDFWPVLISAQVQQKSMIHVPSPNDLAPYSGSVPLILSNAEFQGRRLVTLLQENNLIGADVEISQMAVTDFATWPVDLTAKTGTEHTIQFSGVVRKVDGLSDSDFTLQCFVEMPSTVRIWDTATTNASTTDPRHRGSRLPIAFGVDIVSPMLGYDVGQASVFSDTMNDSEDDVDKNVNDVSVFPQSGDFTVRIDSEDIECSIVSGDFHINSGGRAQNGTSAATHTFGAFTIHIPSETQLVFTNHYSGVPFINFLKFWNSVTGELITLGGGISTIHDGVRRFVPGTEVGGKLISESVMSSILTSVSALSPGIDLSLRWFVVTDQGLVAPDEGGVPELGAAVTTLDSLDSSAAAWDSHSTCDTADDSADFVVGSGSLEVTSTNSSSQVIVRRDVWSAVDMTGKCISFYVKFTQDIADKLLESDETAIFDPWKLIMYSGGGTSDFKGIRLPIDLIRPGVWQLFHVAAENGVASGSGGSFDITDVTQIEFFHDYDNPATADLVINYDHITMADSEWHYKADPGDPISNPLDMLVHWVEYFGREQIDETSRALAETATTSNIAAGDLRPLGVRWEEVAQHLAFLCRVNLVPEWTSNGRVWKFLSADADYKFAAPSAQITEYGSCVDIGRDLDDLATSFTFRYAFDWAKAGAGEEAFTEMVVANPTDSDVSVAASDLRTARNIIGDVEADPTFLRLIDDEPTAEELAGYLVQEGIAHERAVFQISDIPWAQGYKLQLGDIIEVTPPWMDFGDTQQFAMDAVGDWTAHANGDPTLNTTTFHEGSGSIQIDSDNVDVLIAARNATDPTNLRDRAITFWIYTPSAAFGNVSRVQLSVGSVTGFGNDWITHFIDDSFLVSDGWIQARVPINISPDNSAGDYDPTHTIAWQLDWVQDGAAASQHIIFDDVRIGSRTVPCRVISISKNYANEHTDITAVEVVTV